MILNILKKPFAVFFVILSCSGYVSALPVSMIDIPSVTTTTLLKTDQKDHMQFQNGVSDNDTDIKELREEDVPIRDARALKIAKPR